MVPHLGDDAAFEDSLVSVLENRPADAEVCVVHDGRYSDPFQLSDEVRFVASETNALAQLIAAAAETAKGRFVHVIGNGVKATEGWMDAALEKFEHEDVAIVSPLARYSWDEAISAAGWTSTTSRLATPVAMGQSSIRRSDAASICGVCLTASFWRREVLQDVLLAFPTSNDDAAQFGWSRLVCRQGWRCVLADQSVVIADPKMLGLAPSRARGASLREIEAEIKGVSTVASAMSVGIAALTNVLRPANWGEVAGEAMSLVSGPKVSRPLRTDAVRSPGERAETIRLPYAIPANALQRAA